MPEAPARYRFIGPVTTGFFQFTDLDTGQMLVCEPGKDYAIRAVEVNLRVPPDGRFEAVAALPEAAPAPRPAKAAKSTDGEV